MSSVIKNNKEKPRNGYSTGSCAAAASQAALLGLTENRTVNQIMLELPGGDAAMIPVNRVFFQNGKATAEVLKDAGDDPDITNGTSILATVELLDTNEIIIDGGAGVGRVTKPGLSINVGEAAINPVPRAMIRDAVKPYLPAGKGIKIIISAPQGAELAQHTMNPRLGIEGGISILGTTGIVRPMSEEAYLASLVPQMDQAAALGYQDLVFTPGKMGENQAKTMGIAADRIIQTSNYIGTMILEATKRDIKSILFIGHVGKIIKVAAGIFNTHSRIADARRETLAAHAAMMGAPQKLIKEIMELNTMEASVQVLKAYHLEDVYNSVARAASQRIKEYIAINDRLNNMTIGTIVYALNGQILGSDEKGKTLARQMSANDLSFPETGTSMALEQQNASSSDCKILNDKVVKVVGTGPGNPEYISMAGREAINQAEVLVGSRRLLQVFAKPGQKQVVVDKNLDSLPAFIENERQEHQVVILVSGDTGLYSLADFLKKNMDENDLVFIPGISSVQLMFARLKKPWQDALILSMHGRSPDGLAEKIIASPLTALLTGAPWTPQTIAQFLIKQGVNNRPVVLGQNLTYPEEKLIFCSLVELGEDKNNYQNTVMVILNE